MNKQYERYLRSIVAFLDLLALNVVFFLGDIIIIKKVPESFAKSYYTFWIITNTSWLILSFLSRLYAETTILKFPEFIKRTAQIFIFWIVIILAYLFFSRELKLSRLYAIFSMIGFGVGLIVNRFFYLAIDKTLRKYKGITKKVLILGLNNTAQKLTTYFEDEGLNTQMVGYIEDDNQISQLTHYPVLAGLKNTISVAKDLDIEEIYSTITPEENRLIYDLMYQSEKECIRFKIVPNLSQFINRDFHIDYYGDLPVLTLRNETMDDLGNRLKKRILDIIISSFVTVFILTWLLPILGLLIFLESGKPIFFKQPRTGKNLKPFMCWKLRSMKVNKDANNLQAVKNDARITRMGRFIRKTSLDEFPQFFNVLIGNMSLVGPRPHMLKHTHDYSKVVDEYSVRQFAKPGITGWAQINGYRGEITDPEQIRMRVNLDIWYLENWTLWLDIQILFLTIYKIIRGDKHAY